MYNGHFLSLQEKYLTREKAQKDATSQVLQLQSGISSLKNKLADTERQLPALEEAKKAAVAGEFFAFLFEGTHFAGVIFQRG